MPTLPPPTFFSSPQEAHDYARQLEQNYGVFTSIRRVDAWQVCTVYDTFLACALEREQQEELEKYQKQEELMQLGCPYDEEDYEDGEARSARFDRQLREEMEATPEWQRDQEAEHWHKKAVEEADVLWSNEDEKDEYFRREEMASDQSDYARSEEDGWFYGD